MEREELIRLDQCLKKTVKQIDSSIETIEKTFSKIRELEVYKRAGKIEVKKVEQKLELAFA